MQQKEKFGLSVFTQRDVELASSPLDRLMRKIFVQQGITYGIFRSMHLRHVREGNATTKGMETELSNNVKAIWGKNGVTWRSFYVLMTRIFDLELVRFELTFKDRDGNLHTFTDE